MEVVWTQSGPAPVSEILASLPATKAGAYNTVTTTLERLVAKGILSRVKQGKAFLYQAAESREELEHRIVAQALDQLVQQFPQAVASFFVQPEAALSEERLARLQEAIERHREERHG